MFTPPPSPRPFTSSEPVEEDPSFLDSKQEKIMMLEDSESSPLYPSGPSPSSPDDAKRRLGRRYRWAVLLVPVIVIVLTAFSAYTSRCHHKATHTQGSSQQHVLPPPSPSWHTDTSRSRQHGKRAPEPLPQAPSLTLGSASAGTSATRTASATGASSSSSQIPVTAQPVPTIPSAPPTLPTPFPQPFDGSIAQNFSTVSCSNFFANMTNSAPFRSCRPFSLLGTSSDFINAQTNLTLMNSIVWGTCNTTIDYVQCQANMKWFASALNTACSTELAARNSMAVTTLMGLNAFQVMHDVACLPDPTSNVYCYINAVRNPNPSDLYYYQLPQGIPLPKSATPTCSACSKSVMGIYSTSLQDADTGPLLTGLKSAYAASAALSVSLCGAGFAQVISAAQSMVTASSSTMIASLVVLAWMILDSTS